MSFFRQVFKSHTYHEFFPVLNNHGFTDRMRIYQRPFLQIPPSSNAFYCPGRGSWVSPPIRLTENTKRGALPVFTKMNSPAGIISYNGTVPLSRFHCSIDLPLWHITFFCHTIMSRAIYMIPFCAQANISMEPGK